MRKDIHPNYQDCKVSCTCGNAFVTRSTEKELSVTICGECHPFYTGKQKFVDTAGRIEKFQKRFQIQDGQGTAQVMRQVDVKSRKQIMSEAKAKAEAEAKAKAPKKESKTAEKKAKAEGEKAEGKSGEKKARTEEPAAKRETKA
jgi:large subunit ribosomal protein L31